MNQETTTYSKEKIRERMLKRLSTLWDISSTDNLDPIVKLMIEMLSQEIFDLATELSNMDERLLSQLVASVTPSPLLCAQPAHALLSIYPVEPHFLLDGTTTFAYREQKFLHKHAIQSVDFTPIAPYPLVRAKVRYMHIEHCLYNIDNEYRKNVVAYACKISAQQNNHVWIGIEPDPLMTHLESLTFYIDFINRENKEQYLPLLTHTQWSHNGIPAKVEPVWTTENPKYGWRATQPEQHCYNSSNENALVKKELPPDVSIFPDIISFYTPHYLRISGINYSVTRDTRESLAGELAELYSPESVTSLTTPLLWLKIHFPDPFSGKFLESVRIGLNLIPVANLSLRKTTQQMTGIPLFVPLDTPPNEYFIGIHSVSDTCGKIYEAFPDADYPKNQLKGVYSLRRAGVEQFSKTNDAKSALQRLIAIIRDQNLCSNNKARESFNQEAVKLFKLTDKLSKIAETFEGETDAKFYLIADKNTVNETLLIYYRTTNGAIINELKAGTTLVAVSNAAAVESNMFLLSGTCGGKNPPTIEDTMQMHQYMLASHDRIFTKYDIIHYCKAEYAGKITQVDVKQGYGIGNKPAQGMIQTIDVFITPNQLPEMTISNLKEELLCKLSRRSPESFNYRIFINA
ncbi:MAG: hypothetical protein RR555_02295 [Bacteroidales bacterium]